MIELSEFLVFLFAASLPGTYILLMRHFVSKKEAEDLAALAASGTMEPHECCCETAARALADKRETKETVAAR